MKNLKLIDEFEAAGHFYEAYELHDDKILIVDDGGGIMLIHRKYYDRYKHHVIHRVRV